MKVAATNAYVSLRSDSKCDALIAGAMATCALTGTRRLLRNSHRYTTDFRRVGHVWVRYCDFLCTCPTDASVRLGAASIGRRLDHGTTLQLLWFAAWGTLCISLFNRISIDLTSSKVCQWSHLQVRIELLQHGPPKSADHPLVFPSIC